jgi:signal transduction histidine kinase
MIAHNIMPESLVNFGLKDALNDLCVNLQENKSTTISFLFYGDPYRFDNSIETSFFRIAQEAVNNALKYAEASKIVVQLIQDESWVNLTIQDNGKGFDVNDFKNKAAGGIKNIRSRAESFDGRFNIDSQPGIGTEIIVEFIYNKDLL